MWCVVLVFGSLLQFTYSGEVEYADVKYCPVVNPCYKPLLYDIKYRCVIDEVCPEGYKCCRSDCYIHHVCVVPVNKNGDKLPPPIRTTTQIDDEIAVPTDNFIELDYTTREESTQFSDITSKLPSTPPHITTDLFVTSFVPNTTLLQETTLYYKEGSGNGFDDNDGDENHKMSTHFLFTSDDEDNMDNGSGDHTLTGTFEVITQANRQSTAFNEEKKTSEITTKLSFPVVESSGYGTDDEDGIEGSGDDEQKLSSTQSSTTYSDTEFTEANKSETVLEGSADGDLDIETSTYVSTFGDDEDEIDGITDKRNKTELTSQAIDIEFVTIEERGSGEEIDTDMDLTTHNFTIGDDEDGTEGSGDVTIEEENYESTTSSDKYADFITINENEGSYEMTDLTTHSTSINTEEDELTTSSSNSDLEFTEVDLSSTLNITEVKTTQIGGDTTTDLTDITQYESSENQTPGIINPTTHETQTEMHGDNFSTIETELRGSGDGFSDTEDDGDEGETLAYYYITEQLEINITETPNIKSYSANDTNYITDEDDDEEEDDNEVDEDIRTNFQRRIARG